MVGRVWPRLATAAAASRQPAGVRDGPQQVHARGGAVARPKGATVPSVRTLTFAGCSARSKREEKQENAQGNRVQSGKKRSHTCSPGGAGRPPRPGREATKGGRGSQRTTPQGSAAGPQPVSSLTPASAPAPLPNRPPACPPRRGHHCRRRRRRCHRHLGLTPPDSDRHGNLPPPPTPLGHPPRRKSRVYNAHRPPPLARHHRQRGRPRRRRLTDRHSVLCPRKGREARGGEGPLGPPLAGHTSAPRRAPPPPALRAATSPCARPRRRHDGWVGTDTASG